MLSVAAHYCTFSCLSQHIKCIKDRRNSATNKASTTADRVDGWSAARERVWSLVYNVPACVYLEDSTHSQHTQSTKRRGINSMLLRVEPGRHVWWNVFPLGALIWLWFKAMCLLSDISLQQKNKVPVFCWDKLMNGIWIQVEKPCKKHSGDIFVPFHWLWNDALRSDRGYQCQKEHLFISEEYSWAHLCFGWISIKVKYTGNQYACIHDAYSEHCRRYVITLNVPRVTKPRYSWI